MMNPVKKGRRTSRETPGARRFDEPELRKSFHFLLLQNPDYFGNLTAADLAIEGLTPELAIHSSTSFEELTCLSYDPQSRDLRAVVVVKKQSGYSGGPCTNGSKEHVRFYVDYDRDGTWVDEGVANYDVHDLPFPENLCYGVRLRIDPQRRACCNRHPVLPRVRAILSWNQEPPPGQPGWLPVWGNRLEADIQIAPRSGLLCWLLDKLGDLKIDIEPGQLEPIVEALPSEAAPPAAEPLQASLLKLKDEYGADVEGSRLAFKLTSDLSLKSIELTALEKFEALSVLDIDIATVIDDIIAFKFNTSYEEVECVALDRDLGILHASIHIKRASGYLGNLCQQGSREYVAFYMDFGTGWEYVGTSSVRVHDIPEIPDDGLWYHASLPVSLTAHQQAWCATGKARVRAILSWNIPPTPYDPDYVATWGDWEECHVEIKPLPAGVPQGELVPFIEALGGMPVALIASSGYASGTNATGLTALDSPFDGRILVRGIIANAPNSSQAGVANVKYRLMVKHPSAIAFQPWLGAFEVFVTEISGGIVGPQVAVTQTPDPNGWLDYLPDFIAPDIVSVDDNLLGVLKPSEQGLHRAYIEMHDPNTGVTKFSNVINFMVDRTRVEVDIEITSGAGNCGVFTKGDVIAGTFEIKDKHCSSMTLSVTPVAEASGAAVEITPTTTPPTTSLSYAGGTLPTLGAVGTWQLDTGPMQPCGYNVRIRGVERTIIDSHTINRDDVDIEGFCLEE